MAAPHTPDQIEAAHRFGAGPGGYVARSNGCTCERWDRMDRECPMHGMDDLHDDLAGTVTRRVRIKRWLRDLVGRRPA